MVNVFILTDSPKECVKYLDYRRLGKQRVEAKQIIDVIEKKSGGWYDHPVTKMWINNVEALKYYFNCCVDEWSKRGYKNTMEKFVFDSEINEADILPWFYKNKQIQNCYKASLLRKNTEYYTGKITCDDNYMMHGYIWISKLNEKQIQDMKSNIELPLSEICEKFGSGTPPQYRINKELCEKWFSNKNINPSTGRKLKNTGTIYKDFEKASKFFGIK
jgi:hypothetical protein